jgi:DNA-binding NarL/FixJ family response regulator
MKVATPRAAAKASLRKPIRLAAPSSEPPKDRQEILTIVKRLVRFIRNEGATVSESPSDQGVLLSIDCDGIRCQLIRMPPPSPDLGFDVAQERDLLSPRELEIAQMVGRGYPNKTIARALELSVWTVGTYIRRIFAKLQVNCRAAMVAKLHTLRLFN